MRKRLFCLTILTIIGGCVTNSDMQLSQNTYQLETNTGGSLFVGTENRETMKRAAQLTLKNGYKRFVLVNASADQQTSFGGFTPGYSQTTFMGNMATTTYTPGLPIFQHSGHARATLIMLNPGDRGYSEGLDAETVLKQLATR